MLKKEYRLPIKTKRLPASSYKSQTFRLMVARNNLNISRFGFIISKKTAKKAVCRNRIKRVFRSCIEEMQDKVVKGYDMLFILQKNSLSNNRENFCQELGKLFSEIKLIK